MILIDDGAHHEIDFSVRMSDGISSKERRVGPIPPGKYKLEATSPNGKVAKKTVRIRHGQDELKVKLRLKD